MNRRERIGGLNDLMLAILPGWQADIRTAMPGIIESFNQDAMTCEVQPATQALFTSPEDGSQTWITLPLLVDCPVQFQGGGGVTMTFPLTQGDECLIVLADRCIDAWWQSGGVQQQATFRMHDLSDGFVLPGVRSQPRKFSVNMNEAQMRTDDGTVAIGINPTSKAINIFTTGDVNVTSGGTAIVKATTILLQNAGSALKKLVTETFLSLFDNHKHIDSAAGLTSAPTTTSSSADTTSVVQAE